MADFNDAVARIGASKQAKPSNAQKLTMYGYFKYVQHGPCTTKRPGWTDPVGAAKWDAWNSIDASLRKEEVCALYIDLVESLLPAEERKKKEVQQVKQKQTQEESEESGVANE